MRILVACEESQAVCIELRALGHEAYSCDIEPCGGGHPEWHIQQDVAPLINGFCEFYTCDGEHHSIDSRWDMIIAFPPCTYLSNAGAVRLRQNGVINEERMAKAIEAKKFFMLFYEADCERIVIENPVPGRIHCLPKYQQIIEPYMFGDPWKKKTCLWLKGVDPLVPTNVVVPLGLWVGSTSARRDPSIMERYTLHSNRNPKRRSRTFHGIAKAIAEQMAGDNSNQEDLPVCTTYA